MKNAQKLYEGKDNMTSQQIAQLLGPDRLNYLTHHLDVLPSFPIILEFVDRDDDAASKEELPKRPHHVSSLPNCSDVPIADWLPVGIINFANDDGEELPYFQSHKCNYRTLERTQLNYWFAGMRVRYLGDSHTVVRWSQQSLRIHTQTLLHLHGGSIEVLCI